MTSDGSRWSRNDSVLRSSGTRLTATVTISAPDALCAAFISSKLRYFPVPIIRRDVKTRSPIRKASALVSTTVDMKKLYQSGSLYACDELGRKWGAEGGGPRVIQASMVDKYRTARGSERFCICRPTAIMRVRPAAYKMHDLQGVILTQHGI